MPRLTDKDAIGAILRRDPRWCVYALGDLTPRMFAKGHWFTPDLTLVLRDYGTSILFALGAASVREALADVTWPVHLQVQKSALDEIARVATIERQLTMVRMAWHGGVALTVEPEATRLDAHHVAAVQRLYGDGEHTGESPDFFYPSIQLFASRAARAAIALVLAGVMAACQEAPAPSAAPAPADPAAAARDKLIARAKSFELPTAYEPPPGDALSHHTSGFAKTMCSAVFITGYDVDFAAEHVGYFTAPYAERAKVGKPVVDRVKKSVSITLPNGTVRTAVYTGSQGCITLPEGSDKLSFTPKPIRSSLPPANRQDWPMGDRLPKAPLPAGIDEAKIRAAIDAAYAIPEAETTAFVVTYQGRLIGERYGEGITHTTPLESWSMGKSVTSTIMATLIHKGVYKLDQPAPVPEWQGANDPRAQIKIQDILRMSSGIRINAPGDPDYDPTGTYPDHLYLYTGGVDSFKYAATRPPQWPPNTVGRYRNTDPVLVNYLNKLGVETLKEDYLSYPQRHLWDKIGVRTMVMETDPFGNFLTQGYEFMSGRDWARLGNLYLNNGVAPGGERILPEGYAGFVSTLAPAWVADERPVYGGFFWINGDGAWPIPRDAYSMNGAGGQQAWIIPSHDLVVVRLGNYKGQRHVRPTLSKALEILMEAVPKK